MDFTKLSHNNIEFFLHNSCKKWFSLPEKDVYNFIDTLKNNDILYDLGAAEGRFTLYALKKKIKTFSFEPDKYNFSVLEKNINKNNLNKNNIFKIALSDTNEENLLIKGQPWEGGHLKVLENGDRTDSFEIKEKEKVKCWKLDDLIKKNNLPCPTHLKVDIDGSELNFIKGSHETLKLVKEIYIELYSTQNEIIEILEKQYYFKLKDKNQIYSTNNNSYPNLYNYWFTKT